MRLREYAGLSDVGSVRENNEDRWLAHPEAGLFVVADGLGGHAAGEVAAQRAVDELPRLLASRRQALATREDSQVARTLAAVLRALNRKIFQEAQANAAHRGMGTTVVFVLVLDDTAIVASVGDCRAYLHREGTAASAHPRSFSRAVPARQRDGECRRPAPAFRPPATAAARGHGNAAPAVAAQAYPRPGRPPAPLQRRTDRHGGRRGDRRRAAGASPGRRRPGPH